ncbi:MAG: LptF/LptG family permease [Bacteroidales bacterium]|nr:LptF/LptG family permease [Bacteroidales bacterium]
MKKLDKLIIKSYLGPLLMTFSLSLFVFLLQFLWKQIEQIIGKGLGVEVILELVLYACATLVPMALPLAVLLASIMTMGNFGEKYELVAMKAAGISLWRVLRPLIIISVLFSIMAFFFSNKVIPVANMKLRTVLYEVKTKKPTLNIKPNQFYSEIENYTIRIGSKDKEGVNMKDIIVYDHSKDLGNVSVTLADSGQMYATPDGNTLIFRLFSGYTFDEDISGVNIHSRPLMRLNFKEQVIRFDVSDFAYQEADDNRYEGHYKMLDIKALNRNLDTLYRKTGMIGENIARISKENFSVKAQPNAQSKENFYEKFKSLPLEQQRNIDNIVDSKIEFVCNDMNSWIVQMNSEQDMVRRHQIELHRKFTLSAACLILFFIGAPLGAIIRKGGMGMPIVVSTVAFIIYYIVGTMGENATREGEMPIWVGMWLSTIVFLPLGLFLTTKATSDAGLLNAEVWTKTIEKILNKLKNIYRKTK